MREDISHMLNMPEGVRRYRVSPAHWRGGYYEVVATGNGADVIQSIHSHSWRERSTRILQRIWKPKSRKAL